MLLFVAHVCFHDLFTQIDNIVLHCECVEFMLSMIACFDCV